MGTEKENSKPTTRTNRAIPGTSLSQITKQKSSTKRKTAEIITDSKREKCEFAQHRKVHSNCSISIFNYQNCLSLGDTFNPAVKTFRKTCIINHLKQKKNFVVLSPFERRVTAISWHHKYYNFLVASSKSGELYLYNMKSPVTCYIAGTGPGGSIVGVKFSLDDPLKVYTASIAGSIRNQYFDDREESYLLSIGCSENWFSSLDVSYEKKLILAGDTVGNGYLLTDTGIKVWSELKRLHTKKVAHVEFSLADPNIFVTSSMDYSAKLWDIRMLTNSNMEPVPFHIFNHARGVNSAYFSPSNRHSLLTTDQHSQIKVYKGQNWSEEVIIPHPHRQCQHLTPIKANWHPIEDIIVIGRYPDDKFEKDDSRSVDFYDGSTGDLLHKIKSPTGCISVLNAFNISGNCLVSGIGHNLIFMKEPSGSDITEYKTAMDDALQFWI